jgi:hypothetical protein
MGGCTEVLTWTRAVAEGRWQGWSNELCTAAVAGNQIAMLKLLQGDAEVQFDAVNLAAAAAGCKSVHLATMQWICSQHAPWTVADVTSVCIKAAAADDADKLDWLHKNLSCCSVSIIDPRIVLAGVEAGSVSALRWLARAGVQLNNGLYTDLASRSTQFNVLRYLVMDARSPWNQQLARERVLAAGTVEDLQWLAERVSSVWTTAELSRLLTVAAENDNLAVAIWLRQQGAAWPQSFATLNGNLVGSAPTSCAIWSLRAMQWALANGCSWGASWVMCYYMHIEGATAVWAHASGVRCACKGSQLPTGIRAYSTSLQLYAQQQLQQHEGSVEAFDFDSYSMPALQPLEQHKRRAATAVAAAAAVQQRQQQRREQLAAATALADVWRRERQQHKRNAKLIAMAAAGVVQHRALLKRHQQLSSATILAQAWQYQRESQKTRARSAALAAVAAVHYRKWQRSHLAYLASAVAGEARLRESKRELKKQQAAWYGSISSAVDIFVHSLLVLALALALAVVVLLYVADPPQQQYVEVLVKCILMLPVFALAAVVWYVCELL